MKHLFIAVLFLAMAAPAHSHYLNRSQVRLELQPGMATIVLSVDLTEALGGQESYQQLRAVKGPLTGEHEAKLRTTLRKLGDAIIVQQNGTTLDLRLDAFAWPVIPETLLAQRFTVPMTQLQFSTTIDPQGILRLRLDDRFPFPKPIVFSAWTGRKGEQPDLIIAPLVAGDGWSPSVSLDPTEWSSTLPASRWVTAGGFITQGFRHVLPYGLDHTLFIVALLLSIKSIRAALVLITTFTVAHSLSLSLLFLGFVSAPSSWVEIAIAATIAGTALLRLYGVQSLRTEVLLILPFGIIHGFGFASQLQQLGIPENHLVIGLTSFNLGIELAQLLLAVPLLLANHLWGPTPKYQNYVVQPAAVAITAVACFWIAERSGFIGPWVA